MDFATYWQYSDVVTRTLFLILLALSILSWVTGIMRILQSRALATRVADDLSQQVQIARVELADTDTDTATRRLVTEQTLLKHIGRYRFASERSLPILGTTAAIAPFIGLFGTVWGIMSTFTKFGGQQQVTLATVAPGIAEALIATALGLLAAIPAVLAYNRFARDADKLATQMETFMDEFANILQRNHAAASPATSPLMPSE